MREIRYIRSSFGQDDPSNDLEAELGTLSDEQLLERWQKISEELSRRSRQLPFQTFGDHQQAETQTVGLGYIEDELDRRARI